MPTTNSAAATEGNVLSLYQRVNPSKMDMAGGMWAELQARREHVFLNRLHFPPRLFQGATVLDLGCGTGEHTAVYANWGARVHGVDFNEIALDELREFAVSKGLQITSELAKLSEWEPTAEKFDIAISDGVLHHTPDPHASFRKLAASARKGGWVIFSTAPMPGAEQRLWMRRIVQRFSKDLDHAVELVRMLFPEYLDRAVRLGHRTPEQVVSDNFLLEQNVPLGIAEVLDWLEESNVELYRSWPPLEPRTSVPASALREAPDKRTLIEIGKTWTPDTAVGEIDQIQQAFALAENERALREITEILSGCKVFGKGPCGVGEWWVVGRKTP